MPKGQTSRPTDRATKKVMRRKTNKSVQGSRGDAGHFEAAMARGAGGPSSNLAEEQRSARKIGAAFDKEKAKKLKQGIALRNRKGGK